MSITVFVSCNDIVCVHFEQILLICPHFLTSGACQRARSGAVVRFADTLCASACRCQRRMLRVASENTTFARSHCQLLLCFADISYHPLCIRIVHLLHYTYNAFIDQIGQVNYLHFDVFSTFPQTLSYLCDSRGIDSI